MIRNLMIKNDGPEIIASNFWQSEWASAGKYYLSVNARAFRLLIPPALEPVIYDMQMAKIITIYQLRKPPETGLAFEILFDDFSDEPYVLSGDANSIDRLLTEENVPDCILSVWITGCLKIWQYTAQYQKIDKLKYRRV